MRKIIKKKYHAIVKHYSDGSVKIEPITHPDEWIDFNLQLEKDKAQRVPRAEAFLRSIGMHVPGTAVPADLLIQAADHQVYKGPLLEAARRSGMLHVIQVLERDE